MPEAVGMRGRGQERASFDEEPADRPHPLRPKVLMQANAADVLHGCLEGSDGNAERLCEIAAVKVGLPHVGNQPGSRHIGRT